jgi:hypothetical protein
MIKELIYGGNESKENNVTYFPEKGSIFPE